MLAYEPLKSAETPERANQAYHALTHRHHLVVAPEGASQCIEKTENFSRSLNGKSARRRGLIPGDGGTTVHMKILAG